MARTEIAGFRVSSYKTLQAIVRKTANSSHKIKHFQLVQAELLTWLDGDPSIFVVDQVAATAIDEACVVALHQFGALGLLHAGLVSLSHLTWMEKAERLLTAAPSENPVPLPDHKRTADWSGFLTALATDSSAEENLIQFPEPSRS